MVTAVFAGMLLVGLGYFQVRNQNRLRRQMAQLPPDAQWRMKVLFPAVMGLIIVATFIVIFLLRPHA